MTQTKGLSWQELEDLGYTIITNKAGQKRINYNEPPEGKVFVPVETNEDDIELRNVDRRFVTEHKFSATRKSVVMEVMDKGKAEAAKAYIAAEKKACKREERANRCRIISPKTGREIMCPESNRCYNDTCPKKRGITVIEKSQVLSLDWMTDEDENRGFSDSAFDKIEEDDAVDSLKEFLKKEKPDLAKLISMIRSGCGEDEVIQALNLDGDDEYTGMIEQIAEYSFMLKIRFE